MDHRTTIARSNCLTLVAALLAALAAGRPLKGAPFDSRLVPADAGFVVYVDMDLARQAAVGQRLLKFIADDPQYLEAETRLIEAIGFMPLNDIRDLTIWGQFTSEGPRSVLVVRANVDAKGLRQIAGFTPDLKTDVYAGHELLNWADDNRAGGRTFACIANERTVLLSSDVELIKHGIDVINDDHHSLLSEPDAAEKTPMPRPEKADNAWAFVAAIDVGAAPKAATNPILNRLGSILVTLRETDDARTVLRLSGTATDERSGGRLRRMARNAKTLMETEPAAEGAPATTQPETPLETARATVKALVPRLLRTVTIEGEGPAVSLTLTLGNERAIDIVQRLAALRDAERDAAGQ